MNKDENNNYLIFSLGDEKFAVNVRHVITLVESPVITKTPKMPNFILGVMDFRDEAVPVFDTKLKIGMDDNSYNESQLIGIVEINEESESILLGLKMDEVHDVISIDENEIDHSTSMGKKIHNEFIDGYINKDDGFIMLMNLKSVIAVEYDNNKI